MRACVRACVRAPVYPHVTVSVYFGMALCVLMGLCIYPKHYLSLHLAHLCSFAQAIANLTCGSFTYRAGATDKSTDKEMIYLTAYVQ